VQRLSQHDPSLAVALASTQELHSCRDCEIAGHLPPHVLKLILLGPDVRARAGDPVLSVRGIEFGRSFPRGIADVAGIAEGAEVSVLAESRYGQKPEQPELPNIGHDTLPRHCFLPAGGASGSTDTSENNTVFVAAWVCELTPSPASTGLPIWVIVCPSS